MAFTYVMCLLDYLIMFVLPDDATDRCFYSTFSKIRRDLSRCRSSVTSYECCSAYTNCGSVCITDLSSSCGSQWLYIFPWQIYSLSSTDLLLNDRNGFSLLLVPCGSEKWNNIKKRIFLPFELSGHKLGLLSCQRLGTKYTKKQRWHSTAPLFCRIYLEKCWTKINSHYSQVLHWIRCECSKPFLFQSEQYALKRRALDKS